MDHDRSADQPARNPQDAEGDGGAGDVSDPLLSVRAELEDVDELPLETRAEVFERTHEVVVEELRALELG